MLRWLRRLLRLQVRTRQPRDCAVCCAAMATGHTYRSTLRAAGPLFTPGVGTSGVVGLLQRAGAEPAEVHPRPHQVLALIHGRRAVLRLRTGTPNLTHCVYWNGRRAVDPMRPARAPYVRTPVERVYAVVLL